MSAIEPRPRMPPPPKAKRLQEQRFSYHPSCRVPAEQEKRRQIGALRTQCLSKLNTYLEMKSDLSLCDRFLEWLGFHRWEKHTISEVDHYFKVDQIETIRKQWQHPAKRDLVQDAYQAIRKKGSIQALQGLIDAIP